MHGEVDVQLSLVGLLLLTQPLHSSEQHIRADLEFSSDFGQVLDFAAICNDQQNCPAGITQQPNMPVTVHTRFTEYLVQPF